MRTRSRRVTLMAAATSALAIAGTLSGPIVGAAATPVPAVTFSSAPTSAALLAHYTVTPAMRANPSSGRSFNGNLQDQLPDLSPKHFDVHQNAASSLQRNSLAAPAIVPGSATPPKVASFIGQQGSHTTCSYFAQGCNPPDMAVAASPAFVLQGVNTSWEVLSTSGRVLPGWPVSAQRFFNVPNPSNSDGSPCDTSSGSQPFLSDPRAIYDPVDHRFWAAMLQVEGGLGIAPDCPLKTVYYIAVSQTSNPQGNWNVYEFEMAHGTPYAADYTQIGLNSDAVFFSANMFGLSGGFYAEVFEANKAKMENGSGAFTADGFYNLQGNGPGVAIAGVGPFVADTVQPVMAISGSSRTGAQGSSGGNHDGLFVDTIDGPDLINGHLCTSAADACKGLALWRMSNPVAHDHGGPAPTFTGTYVPDTQPFSTSPAADQPSCTACVDGDDLRIPATPVLMNGTIYTGWGTALDNGTQTVPAVEWAQLTVPPDTSTPATRTGYFVLPGDEAATYPAFMPDVKGNVVMLYEHMGATTYPEAKYTVLQSGASQFSGTGNVLKQGEASYRPTLCGTATLPVCRWGDYEALSYDGTNRIWMAGEYANTHTDPAVAPWFGRNWGTWMGSVNAGPQGV